MTEMKNDNRMIVALKELLKQGVLIGSITTTGALTLGPAGGLIGAAAGALLAFVEKSNLCLTAADWISRLCENPLVKFVLNLFRSHLESPNADGIWGVLLNLAHFLLPLFLASSHKAIGQSSSQ